MVVEKFYHSVCLNPDLCKGCINCIKRCPTGAIRVRNGKAQINNKFCIDCGECIRICPHHAKTATYDKIEDLSKYKYCIALPAPTLYSQFNNLDDVNVVLNGLLDMGFDEVYEVSAAAELVSEATRNYLLKHENQFPLISTACPAVVRLIRVKFPNLISQLLPLNPPVEVAARIAVEQALKSTGLSRDEIGVFFLSPCPAKVTYAKFPLGVEKSEINHVLAIKEVYPKLLACMKPVLADGKELVQSGKIGISWGRSGGESSGLFTEECLAADGIESVIRVLEDLEDQKFSHLKFVELNACIGGCIGGVLTVENPYLSETKLKHLRKYMPVSRNHLEQAMCGQDVIDWTIPVEYEPVFHLGNTMLESFARLNQVERLCKKFPGLDCGSCGAPSCKALAEDIVRGDADEKDCIHLLKQNLQNITGLANSIIKDLEANHNNEHVAKLLSQYMNQISEELGEE